MRQLQKFIIALGVAVVLTLLFRALVFTVYTVDGTALMPYLHQGDRILVNRWSYGLRTGHSDGLFEYGRLLKTDIQRGDIIAVENPNDSISGIYICRCKHVPGDTVSHQGAKLVVPGLFNCANEDYYWLESLNPSVAIDSRVFGFVGESRIIGRVSMVVYNHNDSLPIYTGYDKNRFLLVK